MYRSFYLCALDLLKDIVHVLYILKQVAVTVHPFEGILFHPLQLVLKSLAFLALERTISASYSINGTTNFTSVQRTILFI